MARENKEAELEHLLNILADIISELIRVGEKERDDFRKITYDKGIDKSVSSTRKCVHVSPDIRTFIDYHFSELNKVLARISAANKIADTFSHPLAEELTSILKLLASFDFSIIDLTFNDQMLEEVMRRLEKARDQTDKQGFDSYRSAIVRARQGGGDLISGVVRHYLTEKRSVLSQLHRVITQMNEMNAWVRDITPEKAYELTAADKNTLQLLMRMFEDGAKNFPGLRHAVLTWPFMSRMPKPPQRLSSDYISDRRREDYSFFVLTLQSPFTTSETVSTEWYIYPEKRPWESKTGMRRFADLSLEAGRLLVGIARDRTSISRHALADLDSGKVWLYAVHTFRNTIISKDNWPEWSEGGSGLHHPIDYWYSCRESCDVFFDSAFVCNELLNRAEPTRRAVVSEQEKNTDKKQIEVTEMITHAKCTEEPRADGWSQITIEVVDDETIRYEVADRKWKRANYTELGFLDKRKNGANKLWPVFLGLASKNLPPAIKRPRIESKDIDRIRDTLRRFFGIGDLPIKYDKRAKEYRCNFTFNDPRDWSGTLQNENLPD